MTEPESIARYAGLIEEMLRQRLREPRTGGPMDAALLYPQLLVNPGSGPVSLPEMDREAEISDEAGHRRPVYRPLFLYALTQIGRQSSPSRDREGAVRRESQAGRGGGEPLPHGRRSVNSPTARTNPASSGARLSTAVWTALALHSADNPAHATFASVERAQQPDGSFLHATANDNPETNWYHELVILHAICTFAVLTENPGMRSAADRAADFHLEQTQPDHATAQPWGLHAFILNPRTRIMADEILHAVAANPASGAVSSILLGDTLYCLRAVQSGRAPLRLNR